MKLFERRITADRSKLSEGSHRASEAGLPPVLSEMPPGQHSWERTYTFTRIDGYRSRYDSMNPQKAGRLEVELIRDKARSLGLEPVFAGDYITFDSFPGRNIVHEEITAKTFERGTKYITMRVWLDIEGYVPLYSP